MTKKILSDEDAALFRKSVGPVKKVKSDLSQLTYQKKPKPYPKKSVTAVSANHKFDKHSEHAIEKLSHEDSISFVLPTLPRKTLSKLRKGQFGVNASVDLHGLTSQQAKQELSRFLHYSVEEGYQCIHIIHGKGYRSTNDHPILKNDINVWLRQHQDIQAFCSTPPKDGGTGAVFVLLKLSEKYGEQEYT